MTGRSPLALTSCVINASKIAMCPGGKFIYPLSGLRSLAGVISFLRGSHLSRYSEQAFSWCAVKIHQLQRQTHTFQSEAKIVYCIIYDNVKAVSHKC